MKIAFINWMDMENPNSGGAEKYTWELSKRFARDGNSVLFLTSKYKSSIEDEEIDGIHIIRFGNWLSLYIRALFWVSRYEREYDLIFEVINGPPFLLPLKVKRSKHVVVIFHLPTFEATCKKLPFLGPMEFIISRLVLGYFYKGRKVITDSYNTKKELIRIGFTNVFVAEDGLNIDSKTSEICLRKEIRVVVIGPLKPWKRIDHAIKAFSVLSSEWRLDILGNGPKSYLKKLSKLTIELGIAERTKFHGYVDNQTKQFIIGNSLITIVTSEKEGFSLTALECQQYGTVPVAYNFPGIEGSIIPDITSIIVRNSDLASLKNALLYISSDFEKLSTMSKRAIEFSKNFTWDITYEKVRNIIVDHLVQQ